MVPLELPPVNYGCFSLFFFAIALSNPFALSLRNSNSFSGDFIHPNREFPIGACFEFLPPPFYLTLLPTVSRLPPPYSIHSNLCRLLITNDPHEA